MKRLVVQCVVLCSAALLSCDNTTNTAPSQLYLDRPSDIAFGCYGGLRITNGDPANVSQPIITSAQPVSSCNVRSESVPTGSPQPVPPGQDDLTPAGAAIPAVLWYGFILESVPGVLQVAQWKTQPASAFTGADVIQPPADALIPGKDGIAIGDNPIAIGVDTVGCSVVTANANSCDLSEMDITTALSSPPTFHIDRLPVVNGAGQAITAKPAAMVTEPPGGVVGTSCGMTATGLAYVAYPDCHSVATVNLATGAIVAHIDFDTSGVATIFNDGNLTCVNECAGMPVTPGTRPLTLDVQADPRSGRRALAIGAGNSDLVTIVDLGIVATDPTTFDLPQSLFQIQLQDPTGTLSVSQVAISPNMGMGGASGIIDDSTAPGGPFQFVYAVSSDKTVRVADILNLRQECDTQVDPRMLYSDKNVAQLSCLAVGAPTTPRRRPNAIGPGIQLISPSVPTSVTIFQGNTYSGDLRTIGEPATLIGYFGAISSVDGNVYIFNVTDDAQADYVGEADDNQGAPTGTPIESAIPLDIANQLRDGEPDVGLLSEAANSAGVEEFVCDNEGPDPDATGGNDGGTRTPAAPAQTIPTSPVGAIAYVNTAKLGELPTVRQVECIGADEPSGAPVSELGFAAPIPVRDLEFPDVFGTSEDEDWSLTWEGPLASASTAFLPNGPQIRMGQLNIDATDVRVDDQEKPFCAAGVQPYDIVQLRGCNPINGGSDCPVGYECFVHPDSQVTDLGDCMLQDEAPRLADACKEFLISLRRYTVSTATTGELVLVPRKHVLETSPVDGCTSDMQCSELANYEAKLTDVNNPVGDTTSVAYTWSCAVDTLRKPELDVNGAPMKRCIETCTQDSDCVTGNVCQAGYCMEGVVPPQACVNAPQRYEIDGAEAFIATGTHTGYPNSTVVADTNGNCIANASNNPFAIGRIPLRAPPCDPTADPRTGLLPSGVYDNNPCSMIVQQTDLEPNYSNLTTCELSSATSVLVTRNSPGIRTHLPGMTLTLVDTTYPGDSSCIQDRKGPFVDAEFPLGNMPLVQPGYQITWRLTAGFTPLLLGLGASLPVRVRTGPTQSIWVIDAGDYESETATTASTLGKVFRIESVGLGIINTLE